MNTPPKIVTELRRDTATPLPAPAPAPKIPLEVLMVEDVESDALLVTAVLRRSGYAVTATRVDSESELRAALAKQTWDIILCDFSMPGFSGATALRIAKEVAGDVPFIFVSGTIGEAAVVDAMRSGAQDYVMKDRLTRLPPAVARELSEAAMRREARQADRSMRESEHKYRQLFDALTEAIFVIDETTGRIIDTNRRAQHLLQRERHEIVGQNHATLFAPPPGTTVLGELRADAADSDRDGCLLTLLRHDGGPLPVHASASPIELYGRSLLLVLMHVNAERPANLPRASTVKTELECGKRLLDLVGRLVPVGGWKFDPASGALEWSEPVRQIHEVDADFKPTLKTAFEFFAPESRSVIEAAVNRAIRDGVPFDEELSLIGAHGGRHRVRVLGEALREKERTVRIIGVLQDLTHSRPGSAVAPST